MTNDAEEHALDDADLVPADAPIPKQLERSKRLGRYVLSHEIASGGMATIHLARAEGHGGFEKVVAIKSIHAHLEKDPSFVEMFMDEARIASRIDHPNVCRVYDFGLADGSHYMVMEYIVGETLVALHQRVFGKAPAAVRPKLAVYAARIIADACEGLHAAHEIKDEHGQPLGLVHRDISPHNLFVCYDGSVRLVDFGVAKAAGRSQHTKTGVLKGKLAYMAPEQLRRQPIDRRADVWAMGVVLWELVTGRRLFRRDSEIETLLAIEREEPPLARSVSPTVPEEMERIIAKALSRDPAQRFATARELARDLNRFVARSGEPVGVAELAEWMEALFGTTRDGRIRAVEEARGTISERRPRERVGTGSAASAVQPVAQQPVAQQPVAQQPVAQPAPAAAAPAPPAPVPTPATGPSDDELASAPLEESATIPAVTLPADLVAALRDAPKPKAPAPRDEPALAAPAPPVAEANPVAPATPLHDSTQWTAPAAATPAWEPPPVEPAREDVPLLVGREPPPQRTPIVLAIVGGVLGAIALGVTGALVLRGADTAPPTRVTGTPVPVTSTTGTAGTLAPDPSPLEQPVEPAAAPSGEAEATQAEATQAEATQAEATQAEATQGQATQGQAAPRQAETAEAEPPASPRTPPAAPPLAAPPWGAPSPGEAARPSPPTTSASPVRGSTHGTEPPTAETPHRAVTGTGFVNVATPGGWAEVYVGGHLMGNTPMRLSLPAGRHTVELRPGGGAQRIRRTVEIAPDEVGRLVVPIP